jgi:phosphoribosylanthranilate isomerase
MSMKLHTVTISGPDDGTSHQDLLALSREYPFVEWGVLLSSREEARPRYPSREWIDGLEMLASQDVSLSGHVCGGLASRICKGRFAEQLDRPLFQRMQLNVAQFFQKDVRDVGMMAACLPRTREYIIQVGQAVDEGIALAKGLQQHGHCVSILFDASGGRGLLPEQWPRPEPGIKFGYAGGLGPENIDAQLSTLASLADDAPIWIDMETSVRTQDGQRLDLDKVRSCLEIAGQHVR